MIKRVKSRISVIIYSFLKKPEIKNTDETIAYIVKNRCSVSRFGDGEFKLLLGENLVFQKYEPVLANKFKAILAQKEVLNHICCIPGVLIENNAKELKTGPRKYWDDYFKGNYLSLRKYFTFKKPYFDSLISRLYIDIDNKELSRCRFDAIKQVWEKQNILFIEGEQSRLGIGNNLFENAHSVARIICPSLHAFSCYDAIIDYIKENISKDKLILVAAGPTATALAWDLCKLGFWAIDIGHIDIEYEWMNMQAEEKVAIKNKFVGDLFVPNEAKGESIENTYHNSVIKSFVSKTIKT